MARTRSVLLLCGLVFLLSLLTLCSAGCVTGRTDDGTVVLGLAFGQPLPESHEQAITAAAGTVGTLMGGPVGGALATTVVGGILGAFGLRQSSKAAAAQARHEGERAGWDEAVLSNKTGSS